MCYFRYCQVVSDKRVLKRDGIVAYKTVYKAPKGTYLSAYKGTYWIRNRMSLLGNRMNEKPSGTGPGIYAYKRKPNTYRFDDKVVVKVLLYGRVIEYRGSNKIEVQRREPGYMAEKAEIIEEVK